MCDLPGLPYPVQNRVLFSLGAEATARRLRRPGTGNLGRYMRVVQNNSLNWTL